nr:immunoglobulin light chain junction region [Macaca mulatta]MOW17280.1 immunoglobulin light chain junction region [Macaca mulatta]MOW56352.1 immunoglobulin light chain junction region [Macaca mulatta]MOW56465.1 immunoglobulin light chain junction region [Macaca mulatta]MOW56472.1 immunoglobulin light chain junction region [Macaca mulatta]
DYYCLSYDNSLSGYIF